ncbi:MAG: hopanoid biosynthesis-associated protein HpnK [Leptolyngbyaceae cyanobacterium]
MGEQRQHRQLIINGDDFGFSSGVNQAIIDAHQRGVLTSTSLMVTGDAFEEAVALAKAHPTLAIGLHLVLICGRSVLPPEKIPHLVDADRYFSNQPEKSGVYYHFSAAAHQELTLEIRAQLEKFRQTGLPLSHVDGHLHMHLQPIVLQNLVKLAEEFEIRFIRLPLEELQLTLNIDRANFLSKILWSLIFRGLRRYGEGLLRTHNIHCTERVYGLLQTGCMTEDYLLHLIPQIRANLVEIYSHPAIPLSGEPDNGIGFGQAERDALISDRVRQSIEQSGFHLTNYLQLGKAI